jgi:hypothetical protein
MAKKSIITIASVAALILPLSAFAQGSAGTGSTSTGIGAPAGPRDLEYGATAGPSNPGQRRTQPQPEATISVLPKRIRYRQQMRYQRTRRAIRNSRVLKCSRLAYQVRAGGKAPGSTGGAPPSSSTR